jgi:subtilisin family serine protease
MATLKFNKKLPSLKQIKSLLINEALKRSKGNQILAAQMLGVTIKGLRQNLRRQSLPKNILVIFFILLSFSISHANELNNYVKGQVVVKFKSDTSREKLDELTNKYDLTVRENIPQIDYYVFDIPETYSVFEVISLLSGNDIVEKCEPNYIAGFQGVPNDDLFSRQWGLSNEYKDGSDIHILEAWDVEKGDPDIIVAIIDIGFDTKHEDLQENLWHNPGEIPDNGVDDDNNGYVDDIIGWDFVDQSQGLDNPDCDWKDQDNDPTSKLSSHGTKVWGVLGATTDNELGIAGVAGSCKIMLIRAGYFNTNGEAVINTARICSGVIYAADNGARVINISSGSTRYSSSYKAALEYAINKGVLIVTSVGNEASNMLDYPAALDLPGILSVGASTSQDQKASFSNYGDWVDISAPGENVITTAIEDGYEITRGTSFAAPMAAGVAALLFSQHPNWSPSMVQDRIMNTADICDGLAKSNITSGRLNAYRALTNSSGDSEDIGINQSAASDGGSGGGGCFIVSTTSRSLPFYFYPVIAVLAAVGLAIRFETN